MHQNELIIAIDGYSACGKSTLARSLAKALNIRYIDSGAMYRAVTLYFLRNNIPVNEEDNGSYDYSSAMKNIKIDFSVSKDKEKQEVLLNNEPVEKQIRQMDVSNNVSQVSKLSAVRSHLVYLQQQMKKDGGLVMDGRDIGTVVFPDAHLKLFMTASPKVRAARRFAELQAKGVQTTLQEVEYNLNQRDFEDTHRKESPLLQAPNAIVLDNSNMNQDEQLNFVLKLVKNLSNQLSNENNH